MQIKPILDSSAEIKSDIKFLYHAKEYTTQNF